jgi:hypothetical protein
MIFFVPIQTGEIFFAAFQKFDLVKPVTDASVKKLTDFCQIFIEFLIFPSH